MSSVAIAIICKTPRPGRSKTRLSPPLRPEECAEISACFIRDLSTTIAALAEADGGITPYALYTPAGSEDELRQLLPGGFRLTSQADGDLGHRLLNGVIDLLDLGHAGAIIVNSDSPTLPLSVLRCAVEAVRCGDQAVLSPARDGGYTLIGLSRPHAELFADIPWSTDVVYEATCARARQAGITVATIDGWYDVDDAQSFAVLEAELAGIHPPSTAPGLTLQDAPHTRRFVASRQAAVAAL
ncbi:TIGR04282 family arsenosugar biosynthesis glycosyltransferase [Marinivivus vitaminiproducens]|uniref:TIGR04282 family arsenosugar biosynthesis glycosyltransferase n=1 Tax=Marinivivus vitaminiproducens TaxID=3035935 RepID=UPI0027A42091|nr:TIGR04282 family arsenosugar biosynthesis glycosyltransferase [Geminicoccaceae bacterium SCSIO 64248]